MRRELSSPLTPVYRWVIPGLLTLAAIAVIWRVAGFGNLDEPATASILRAVALAALLMLLARWFDRAKKVWIEGNALVVSDFRNEIRIELDDISSVAATRFVKPDRIKVRFAKVTLFGDAIIFFPRDVTLRPGAEHPLAGELRRSTEHGSTLRNAL